MKVTSIKRLEKALRLAREQVFSGDTRTEEKSIKAIARCKRLLKPLWDKEYQEKTDKLMNAKLNTWYAIQ